MPTKKLVRSKKRLDSMSKSKVSFSTTLSKLKLLGNVMC